MVSATLTDVRPADCAGFPHHTKKKMIDYMHVYKQNVEYCPATYKMVERMMAWMEGLRKPQPVMSNGDGFTGLYTRTSGTNSRSEIGNRHSFGFA